MPAEKPALVHWPQRWPAATEYRAARLAHRREGWRNKSTHCRPLFHNQRVFQARNHGIINIQVRHEANHLRAKRSRFDALLIQPR